MTRLSTPTYGEINALVNDLLDTLEPGDEIDTGLVLDLLGLEHHGTDIHYASAVLANRSRPDKGDERLERLGFRDSEHGGAPIRVFRVV